jgi:predicted Zn-dependent peptidase
MRGLALTLLAASCAGRVPAPATLPAPDAAVTELSVHGVTVLVERAPGAETVALQLFIRGGVRNWSAGDAGVERLALTAAVSGGTTRLDKDAYTRRLADLGSSITAVCNEDYAVLAGKALRPGFDATFELLVDAFRRPALPAAEIELVRQQQLAALQHEQEQPDSRLRELAWRTVFRGHAYANRPIGTPASVAALDRAQLVAHIDQLRQAARLVVVVVGDVDPAHVADLVARELGDLPRGEWVDAPLAPPALERDTLTSVADRLPTNYVTSVFLAPAWRDADAVAARVALRLLFAREFEAVRTKRSLSYAPGVWSEYLTSVPLGFLYVSAARAGTTLGVMLDELHRLQREPVDAAELRATQSMLLTEYFLANETTDGEASQLGLWLVETGDWRGLKRFPERARAVTPAEVQAVTRHYAKNLQTFIIGDAAQLDAAMLAPPAEVTR